MFVTGLLIGIVFGLLLGIFFIRIDEDEPMFEEEASILEIEEKPIKPKAKAKKGTK